MFFGLTNSPATFQSLMNSIFADLIAVGKVAVYLDDILIFTATLEEHHKIVHEVLRRLRKHDLYLRPEKCEFEREQIEYLGLVIREGQVAMDSAKVEAVRNWPIPKTLKDVRGFLGFANFYRRFINGFSRLARPPLLIVPGVLAYSPLVVARVLLASSAAVCNGDLRLLPPATGERLRRKTTSRQRSSPALFCRP